MVYFFTQNVKQKQVWLAIIRCLRFCFYLGMILAGYLYFHKPTTWIVAALVILAIWFIIIYRIWIRRLAGTVFWSVLVIEHLLGLGLVWNGHGFADYGVIPLILLALYSYDFVELTPIVIAQQILVVVLKITGLISSNFLLLYFIFTILAFGLNFFRWRNLVDSYLYAVHKQAFANLVRILVEIERKQYSGEGVEKDLKQAVSAILVYVTTCPGGLVIKKMGGSWQPVLAFGVLSEQEKDFWPEIRDCVERACYEKKIAISEFDYSLSPIKVIIAEELYLVTLRSSVRLKEKDLSSIIPRVLALEAAFYHSWDEFWFQTLLACTEAQTGILLLSSPNGQLELAKAEAGQEPANIQEIIKRDYFQGLLALTKTHAEGIVINAPAILGLQELAGKINNLMLFPLANGGYLIAANKANNMPFTSLDWECGKMLANFISRTLDKRKFAVLLNNMEKQRLLALTEIAGHFAPYLHSHLEKTAKMAVKIGEKLKLAGRELELLFQAALVHDIGMIGIRQDIVLKPALLTTGERLEIKKHPLFGGEILKKYGLPPEVLLAVEQHHEYWNGLGYPRGLYGKEIHLYARILAVADVYSAMTSFRHYRMPKSKEEAVAEISSQAGAQFDPLVVDAFLEVLEEEEKAQGRNLASSFSWARKLAGEAEAAVNSRRQ
ncbi:HD-GYP domain-containing protein [Carboxydocella sp. ULO1]|uniref:HD-GYP domain-containing protein n=1 Tax=Carboxydocella sp. ULO1 TaxID=1926599 RepID=UPI0009AD3C6B|nr:HD-GYP domain-containing protein [Carboxydocella sp. ULO1]GAW29343.1 hypothetical protein ULO1_19130 [Carboxydocella sp. ULO1]